MNAFFQIRDWTPEDHPMIEEWRAKRGAKSLPHYIVPPIAVVVTKCGEPCAFSCMFVTIQREGGCPLGWCEAFTTAPGLPLRDSLKCASIVLDTFRAIGKELGCSAMFAYCSGGVSRVLRNLGMRPHGTNVDCLFDTFA